MKTTCLLLVTLALAGTMNAAPVIDIAFSDGTTGATPPVTALPAAGAVISRPTSTYVAGGATLLLTDNYTAGETVLTGRSVVMTVNSDPAARQDAQINIRAHNDDFSGGQDYRLSFDMLVNGAIGNLTRNSLRLNFYNTTFSAPGYQASIVLNNYGTQLISGSNNTTFATSWTADTLLQWEIDVLYSTGELVVKLNGSDVGTIALSPASLAGIGGIQFLNGAQNSHFQIALANIEAAAIPEPSTLAILAAGSSLLLFLNRKRRNA